jgi:serine phosphatase RsbU (regulator of sigma subunit)
MVWSHAQLLYHATKDSRMGTTSSYGSKGYPYFRVLTGATHEKDELLDSQEEFLIKENKRHVKVKNAYAQEVEKNENLSKELSICHDTISNLRTENVNLLAKVEKSNACHDSIINLKNDNDSLITKIDKLNESLSSLKI